jgi:hypothetical protein
MLVDERGDRDGKKRKKFDFHSSVQYLIPSHNEFSVRIVEIAAHICAAESHPRHSQAANSRRMLDTENFL